MKKTTLVLLSLALLSPALNPAYADTASTYAKTCGVCHDAGSLNAPKKDDSATWQKLIAQKSMAGLIKSTKQGMPQMPAMGLCQTCSDSDFQALIEYMAK